MLPCRRAPPSAFHRKGTGRYSRRFIEKVREGIAGLRSFCGHALRTVLRIGVDVVRCNRDDGEPARLVLAREAGELHADVLHVRAVIADECHEQRRGRGELIDRHDAARIVGQAKRRRLRAEREHVRFDGHGRCPPTVRVDFASLYPRNNPTGRACRATLRSAIFARN